MDAGKVRSKYRKPEDEWPENQEFDSGPVGRKAKSAEVTNRKDNAEQLRVAAQKRLRDDKIKTINSRRSRKDQSDGPRYRTDQNHVDPNRLPNLRGRIDEIARGNKRGNLIQKAAQRRMKQR
jgi:hypothetical protein